MPVNAVRCSMFLLTCLFSISIAHGGELTLETGDGPGELFFLWQEKLTRAGATSHRLSAMTAFQAAYAKWLIDEIEVLEVRELDTDQPLLFTYVTPPKATGRVALRDVVWYYPNPIPSGGRARVQIRGRLVAPKVYAAGESEVRIDYEAGEGVFIVIPLGFALTYCNSPVIVYEKNARTVCSFSSRAVSLIAKNIQELAATAEPPTISRVASASPVQSRLPFEVTACQDSALLDVARERLSGSEPVAVVALDPTMTGEDWAASLTPGTTVIWKINNVVVGGMDAFTYLASHLEIGSGVTLHVADVDTASRLTNKGPITVYALAANK